MMKQREIVKAELARRLLKQGVKVSIVGAKTGPRFEVIDEAGEGQRALPGRSSCLLRQSRARNIKLG